MLGRWIRNKLRAWLAKDDAAPTDSRIFEIRGQHGDNIRVKAIDIQGTSLYCNRLDSPGNYILTAYPADPARFWRVWQAVGGASVKLTWEEDGEAFTPPSA